jgi:phosphoribosylaminoimidazole-succinocarboxamide synthase
MTPDERRAWLKNHMAKNREDEIVKEAYRKLKNKNKAARRARKKASRARRGK